MENFCLKTHPDGENPADQTDQLVDKISVDTFGGRVRIDWDHETPVTPMGQLAFFIEFLKRIVTQRYFGNDSIVGFIGPYTLHAHYNGEDR